MINNRKTWEGGSNVQHKLFSHKKEDKKFVKE
jgi:hypothetical protein